MLKIINYKYFFVLALLVNFLGMYPSKGLSNTGNNQTTSTKLAQKYKELDSLIENFVEQLKKTQNITKINSSEQKEKLKEIYNFGELGKKQTEKIQEIINSISHTITPSEEDGLTAEQKQLGFKENGSIDVAKNQVQNFLAQKMELLKNEIDSSRIDLLEKEINDLKTENENTKSWVQRVSLLGIVLVILGLFGLLLDNVLKKEPKKESSIPTEAEAEPSELFFQADPGNQTTETEKERTDTSESDNRVEAIRQEENTVTKINHHQEAEPQELDSHTQPGNQEKEEGKTNYQGDNSTVIQPPALSANNLVDIFNNNPKLFSQNAIEVSETSESIDNRLLDYNQPVVLEKVSRNKGIAWVINIDSSDLLIPKNNLKINEYNYQTIESLFTCKDYKSGQSDDFRLVKPAKLTPKEKGETWELTEKGELQFN